MPARSLNQAASTLSLNLKADGRGEILLDGEPLRFVEEIVIRPGSGDGRLLRVQLTFIANVTGAAVAQMDSKVEKV